MKNISIFGSTGSIGRNALDVIRNLPGRFRVTGLSTNRDIMTLRKQIEEFNPSYVCVCDAKRAAELKRSLGRKIRVFSGSDGLTEFAANPKVNLSVFAVSGSAALLPLMEAIKNGNDIALANKEALVMSGPIIMRLAKRIGVKIIPVDSEQSAIWQCLIGQEPGKVMRVYLTASGGPLLNKKREYIDKVTVAKVLRHPKWKMGRKITVDSATLMNKGLEFLEAMFLFNLDFDKIKVLIHPQALIHSMVEFVDGVILAQLSAADMRIPIKYAICYPERVNSNSPRLDFYRLKELTFRSPDAARFPCLGLAYQAAQELGSLPAVMNAANEVAVEEFLRGRMKFSVIAELVGKVMRRHRNVLSPGISDILDSDNWARQEARGLISRRLG